MREPRNYDPLRETARGIESQQQVKETGNDLAAWRGGDRQEPAQEPPFLTEMEKHEAARDTKIQELDERVQAGRITSYEMKYQLSRFENEVSPVKSETGREQPAGQQRERKLVFSEDREREAAAERSDSQASRDGGERGEVKDQSAGRTLSFFEDRNNDLSRDR